MVNIEHNWFSQGNSSEHITVRFIFQHYISLDVNQILTLPPLSQQVSITCLIFSSFIVNLILDRILI